MYNPICTAIGIEIETSNLALTLVDHMTREKNIGCHIDDDGSVRHFSNTVFGLTNIDVKNMEVYKILKAAGIHRDGARMGAELVSRIILTSDKNWEKYVFDALETIDGLGEGLSLTTGVHVHVNAQGLPVEVLHNLINLWTSIEAGIYKLSCGPMGFFRGDVHKDSHYCRPLTEEGPLVLLDGHGIPRQSYTVENLLKTESVIDFAKAYGRSDKWSGRHWHTPRYSGLNFHSLFRLGSIEFRTFNSSLVPAHVLAWIELSKAMVRKAMNKFNMGIMPKHPYGTRNISLDYILDVLELPSDRTVYTLEDLWNMGRFPSPLKGYRFTHLNQGDSFSWGADIKKSLIPLAIDTKDTHIDDSDSYANQDVEVILGSVSIPMFLNIINTYNKLGRGR